MNTPTHILIASGLLSRGVSPARNWAAFAGGLLPDVPMFALFAWEKFVAGYPEQVIFGQHYFSDSWQIPIAITHSIPLALLLLGVGLWRRIVWLWVFALGVLLHIAFDMPFHHDDAHAHFWPFTMWKFYSPLSYWDPAYHGDKVRWLELAIVLGMTTVLWRRFERTWVRAVLGMSLLGLFAAPMYFMFFAHHFD